MTAAWDRAGLTPLVQAGLPSPRTGSLGLGRQQHPGGSQSQTSAFTVVMMVISHL